MLSTAPQKVFQVFRKNYKEIPLYPFFKTPFKTLVAVMLSARARDKTTAKVCTKLFKIAPTPAKLARLPLKKLYEILHPIGFYGNKSKNLHKLAVKLIEDFESSVPSTLEKLITLPGVGRKTANVVLAITFRQPAIGVDTHIHRIANTLGWVKTKTPHQTERELTKVLPKKYWIDTNPLFVSIGQQYRTQEKLINFLKENKLLPNI